MRSRGVIGVIYRFAFGIVLFSALTTVVFGSSETSMGNTSISLSLSQKPFNS